MWILWGLLGHENGDFSLFLLFECGGEGLNSKEIFKINVKLCYYNKGRFMSQYSYYYVEYI